MKHILCFGDSNTFGTIDFMVLDRFDLQTRWTGLLATELGSGYRVIEEGMPGRTTAFEDPLKEFRSGRKYLPPCLSSHRPLDLVIVMLGTNDLQMRFSASPVDIATGIEILVDLIQKAGAGPEGGAPEILIVAPPPIGSIDPVEEPCWHGAHEKCAQLETQYERIAKQYRCHFVNSQEVLTVGDLGRDGLHLARSGHAKLAKLVTKKVMEIVSKEPVGSY
jgi:lysophospholipase L1-like esterase